LGGIGKSLEEGDGIRDDGFASNLYDNIPGVAKKQPNTPTDDPELANILIDPESSSSDDLPF